ncbi:MAG: hypothetical protein ACR65U_14560 [Methylocystis sp.]
MSGYIEVSNMHGDGIQSSYYVGPGSFALDKPTSLWIVPGTLTK